MSVNIEEIVPVYSSAEHPTDSREAHFNWLVESANGSPARIGQYPCGSYWVAPAAGDTGVNLLSFTGNPENTGTNADILRLDADPVTWSHAFGTGRYSSYNAAEDEIPNLPKVFTPSVGSCISLVACMIKPVGRAIPVSEGGVSVVGSDISFQASDNSLNSASGSFGSIFSGWYVAFNGATGNPSNNGYARVESASPTKLILSTSSLVGITLTDEAAGDTITVQKACRGGGTNATELESIDAFSVLTILDDTPADGVLGANSIRPPFLGVTKELLTFSDLDLSNLPSLTKVGTRTAQDYLDDAAKVRHMSEVFAQWSADGAGGWTKYSEGGRGMRALLIQDDYGAGAITSYVSSLLNDNTDADKKPLLAAVVAYGLDIYHQHYSQTPPNLPAGRFPGLWGSGAGQSSGSATGAYFAAAMLGSGHTSKKEAMQRIAFENWDEEDIHRGPDEMRHNMRGPTGVLVWGNEHERRRIADTTVPYEAARVYWGELEARNNYDGALGSPTVGGKKTAADPHGYIDGVPGGPGGYMDTTYGPTRSFAALTVLIPALAEVVNNTDIFEYADRTTRHGKWTQPDPVKVPTVLDQGTTCNPLNDTGACTDYRILWGPSAADWRQAIEGTPGDPLVGRYASKHGNLYVDWTTFSIYGYTWEEIIALHDGPTYDQRAVPLGTAPAPDIYTYPEGGSRYAIIRCGLDDAQIFYTLDGNQPTVESSEATPLTPILITPGNTIKAIAVKSGFTTSDTSVKVDGGTYYVGATPPIAKPSRPSPDKRARVWENTLTVSLSSSPPQAPIYYTTDGSAPTNASTLYTGAIAVNATTRIRAIAQLSGGEPSDEFDETYTIDLSGVPSPPIDLVVSF